MDNFVETNPIVIFNTKIHPDKVAALNNKVIVMEPDGNFKEPYVSNIIKVLKMLSKKHKTYVKKIANAALKANCDQSEDLAILSDFDIIDTNLQHLTDYNSMINHLTVPELEAYIERYKTDSKFAKASEKSKNV